MLNSTSSISRFIFLILFFAVGGSLTACNPEDADIGDGDESGSENEVILSVDATTINVAEGSDLSFTVELSEALESDLNVNFLITGDNSSEDVGELKSLVIVAGNTQSQVQLAVVDDKVFEGDETFEIEVSVFAQDEIIIENNKIAFTIVDMQSAPEVNLAIESEVASLSDLITIDFDATVASQSNYVVPLEFEFNAVSGDDFSFTAEVDFADGATSKPYIVYLDTLDVSEGGTLSVSVAGSSPAFLEGENNSASVNIISESSASVTDGSPWGIAPSHASSAFTNWWFDPIRQSGIDWVRGYDRRAATTDEKLTALTGAGYQVTGILQWSAGDGFPDEDIDGWKAHVLETLQNAKGRVTQWEVWNEPPNFSDDKNPSHYAAIVRAAYEVVKEFDPTMSVALSASSVNLNFLDNALQDNTIDGIFYPSAANHFDYLTLHPYETAHNMMTHGFDAQYMAVVPTVRKMLANRNPEKTNVPVVVTEIGTPILPGGEKVSDLPVDVKAEELQRQGVMAFKTFVMGIAQGMARIHWFEPLDNETLTFGLIEGNAQQWTARPSYYAIQTLIEELGEAPQYIGWVDLGDHDYAFVLQNEQSYYLAAWKSPLDTTTKTVGVPNDSTVIDPLTRNETITNEFELSSLPVLVKGVSNALIDEAKTNKATPFPWGGDYSNASSVELTANASSGLHTKSSNIVEVDGEQVFDIGGGPAIAFTIDPNFLSYDSVPVTITAEVKFKGDPSDSSLAVPGFNLKYESAKIFQNDNQCWCRVPKDDQWHTITWTVDDARFVGFLGLSFYFGLG